MCDLLWLDVACPNRANVICCCWRSATLPCMRLIAGGVANCNYDLADVTLHVINSWCRKLLLAGGESRSNSSLPSSPPPPPWKVGQTVLEHTVTYYSMTIIIAIIIIFHVTDVLCDRRFSYELI